MSCNLSYLLPIFLIQLFSCNSNQEKEIEKQSQNRLFKDTLYINLVSKKDIDDVLYIEDEFQNQNLLTYGVNKNIGVKLIGDSHWQHQLIFPILDGIKRIDFELRNGFWYAKTSNEKRNKIINFEVYFRQNIDPLKKVSWDFMKFNKPIYGFDYKLREFDIEKYYNRKIKYMKEYACKNRLDSSFFKVWQPIISLEKTNDRLLIMNIEKWDKEYLKSMTILKHNFNNESCLSTSLFYSNGLLKLCDLLTFLDTSKNQSYFSKRVNAIKLNFIGKHRDFLLMRLLLSCKDKNMNVGYSKIEYNELLKDFLTTCQVSEYKEYIFKANKVITLTSKQGLLKLDGSEVTLGNIVNQNSLTYIDFWASWCSPCRTEMPESKKLKREYDGKGIDFVYVSVDENAAAWENAVKQIGLTNKDNYLLPDGKESEIGKQFKINTIPRYVIIDKNNKVIDSDAPRPSDPKIRQIFDDLLKK